MENIFSIGDYTFSGQTTHTHFMKPSHKRLCLAIAFAVVHVLLEHVLRSGSQQGDL